MEESLEQKDRDKIAAYVVKRNEGKRSNFKLTILADIDVINSQLKRGNHSCTPLSRVAICSIFDTLLQQIIVDAVKRETEKRVTAQTIKDTLTATLAHVHEDRLPPKQICTPTTSDHIAKKVAKKLKKDVSFSDGGLVLIGNAVGLQFAEFTKTLPRETTLCSTKVLKIAEAYIKPQTMKVVKKRWGIHLQQVSVIDAYQKASQAGKVIAVVEHFGYAPAPASVINQILAQVAVIVRAEAAKADRAKKRKRNGRKGVKRTNGGKK